MHTSQFIRLPALALAATLVAGSGGRGSWQSLAPIPIAPRQEHGTVAISSNTIAIVGGIIPSGIVSNGTGFNTTSIVQLYDILDNQWTSGASAPVEVNHPNLAAVDGKIYLLGGLGDTGAAWDGFPDSFVYDSATNNWDSIEPMPIDERRGSAAVGVYNKTIYLAGGLRTLELRIGGIQATMDVVSAFDTVSGKWTPVPEIARRIPEGRDHAGGAVVGHHFYVLGGRRDGLASLKDTVFVLDLEDMERGWRTSEGRFPTPRGGLSAATIGHLIYTFGGEGNPAEGSNGVFNETEAFDTRTETWTRLRSMAVPRHGTSAVGVGGRVFIPGGGIVEAGYPVSIMDAFQPC
ncbi:hypothetical protein S40288_06205 [Stachybotrys chartarum IBT 40288]|nr:hypothetical protein S40288_06205 [Stachybotrys chartarum IBT 40288]